MSAIPVAQATPVPTQLVEVVAPSTLQAGYTFMADVGGKHVSVTVPEGGVKEGQRFTVPVPADAAGESTALTGTANNIPRGHWRDGLCDCCSYGPFHPHLWNAWCCPLILMGQVLTRMNMSWLGERNSPNSSSTFTRLVWLVVIYIAVNILFSPPSPVAHVIGEGEDIGVEVIQPPINPITYGIYQAVNFAYGLYALIILVKLRAAIRERYSLPNQTHCGDLAEDVCCSLCCACCTNAQLARHTADYNERRAVCCSNTGLPPAPISLVV